MAIDFNDKVLITNPTSYYLGRSVLCVGILAIILGAITSFTGDFLIPGLAWIVCGSAPTFIGWILMISGVRKN